MWRTSDQALHKSLTKCNETVTEMLNLSWDQKNARSDLIMMQLCTYQMGKN